MSNLGHDQVITIFGTGGLTVTRGRFDYTIDGSSMSSLATGATGAQGVQGAAGAQGATGAAATDHSSLTNLENDDHTQYVLTDGTRNMTYLACTGSVDIRGAAGFGIKIGLSANTSADGVAIGNSANSSATRGIAIGASSNAGGQNIAVGWSSSASNQFSSAFGRSTTVTGFRGTSLGSYATSSGTNALAAGAYANTTADSAIALGDTPNATGLYSIAIGRQSIAGHTDAIALGRGATTRGQEGIGIGQGSIASALRGVAVGPSSVASGSSSLGLGFNANASGVASIQIGAGSNSVDNMCQIECTTLSLPDLTGVANGYVMTCNAEGVFTAQAPATPTIDLSGYTGTSAFKSTLCGNITRYPYHTSATGTIDVADCAERSYIISEVRLLLPTGSDLTAAYGSGTNTSMRVDLFCATGGLGTTRLYTNTDILMYGNVLSGFDGIGGATDSIVIHDDHRHKLLFRKTSTTNQWAVHSLGMNSDNKLPE